MDARYPDFTAENQNVRLGVVADGFNPYRSMNLSHSTWPIVLVNYNLPWLCIKQENPILSTLISGPDSPKNNIDVYMQPLISELKALWKDGVETYDSLTSENFNLRASALWIISNFLGYSMLSGWSTKGKLACPECHYETSSVYLKHRKKIVYMNHRKFLDPTHEWRLDKKRYNDEMEMGNSPVSLTGTEIEELLWGYENQFGDKTRRKHKRDRGIRKPLHPIKSEDGKHIEIMAAIFDMTNKEKENFGSLLKNAKFPYGCASNVSREVEYDGLEHLSCMFAIERYLGKLKGYVRNRSRPEGSIVEGYLAEECVTFCSRFLDVDGVVENNSTDFGKYGTNMEYHIGTKKNKDGRIFKMKDADWKAAHRCILFNSDNKEIESLIEEYRAFMDGLASQQKYKRERAHMEDFWKWLKDEVLKKENISRDLEVFALGPNRLARKFTGYVINGYRFHTKFRDSQCTTQNSGVFLTAETTTFASSKDQNPVVGGVNYYGSIEEIFELDYWGAFTVVLFKCPVPRRKRSFWSYSSKL
ncbi:uncharacterized protein LOC141703164 [Apium graveolens]|uniref:uncharacterized protein LOC141703164 n=1 Tax=Apium graveolens TaxID=4045 RepID=UPI003D7AF2DB